VFFLSLLSENKYNMQAAKLAILDLYDGTPNLGMGSIKEIVSRFNNQLEWKVFDVRSKGEVPDMSYDIYISSGGPGSPLDGDGTWDVQFYNWMDAVWQWNKDHPYAKKHVFFICHSFQMACKHFELALVTKRKSQSFGTFPVHLTDLGVSDPLLGHLSNPFHVADFRDYQVIQPDEDRLEELGAEILALEKIRPHVPLERAIMAVRFSDEIIGVQFHPEADPEGMLSHFRDPERKRKVIAEHKESKYRQMIADINDPNKLDRTYRHVLPAFLKQSIQSVKWEVTT
jgi:GMP synthase-like glutamine amidotransferase